MKLNFVITSIISIVSFVGIASAQHVQVFDASFNGGVFVGLTPVSATSGPVSGPNVSSFAGQTVRIRIRTTTDIGDENYIYVLIGTPPGSDACTPASLFFRPASGTTMAIAGVVIAATSDNNRIAEYKVPTDLAWKGTCRVMSVRLRDGSEHLGRIFFK